MDNSQALARILESGIVAIVRAPSAEQLGDVAQALLDGGIDVIEFTFTTPGALDAIGQVRRTLGDRVLLGAGSVLDGETARAALLAGAEFIVAPTVNPDVIQICRRYGKLVMPGAFTPTEVLAAWQSGGDIVKVFPADLGGPAYLKALHGPLPQVRLLPTGGVDLQTMRQFFQAGACAVGVGGSLVDRQSLELGRLGHIRDTAAQFVEELRSIRSQRPD